MNFDLSEEQAMLKDSAHRFFAEQYDFETRRKVYAGAEGWSREHWQQYAEMGWLALLVPEDCGGLGFSAAELGLVMEEVGYAMALEPVLCSAVISARLIDRAGAGAQRTELLPLIATGEAIVTLAHEEIAQRGPSMNVACRATKQGDGYLLNGAKTVVMWASAATHLIVSAAIEDGGAKRLGLFVVPAGAAGLSLTTYPMLDRRQASDVTLAGVQCPAASLLAEGAAAEAALDEALDWGRLAAMAEALGAMQSCLDTTSEYIKTRVQFKQPIGKFQSLQHLMSDMFVDAQDARSILYQAYAHMDDTPAARRQAVAAARVFVGEAGRRVSASGVQMHGGYGMTDEYRISHHFKQLLVLNKLFGDVNHSLATMAEAM